MGYVTVYIITINASSYDRKIKIAKMLYKSSSYAPKYKKDYKKEIDDQINTPATTGTIFIESKWWNPVLIFNGDYWDENMKCMRSGLGKLKPGESIHFDCVGEDDEDRWKIDVKRNTYIVTRAERIEYVDKKERCDNDEDSECGNVSDNEVYKCTGCGACATIVPIYDA